MSITLVDPARFLENCEKFSLGRERTYFLGTDYQRLLKLRSKCEGLEIETLGREFHRICDEMKDSYLAMFTRLYQLNKAPWFWMTPLFSRSASEVPLQRNIIFFLFFVEACRTTNASTFIVEDPDLLDFIKKFCHKQNLSHRTIKSYRPSQRKFRNFAKALGHPALFFYRSIRLLFYFRLRKLATSLPSSDEKNFLFRSWYVPGSIDETGTYRDRNFGPLPGHIESQNGKTWVAPLFLKMRDAGPKEIQRMIDSDQNFLFPEAIVPITRIVATWWKTLRARKLNADRLEVSNHDVTELVTSTHKRTYLSFDLLTHNLFEELVIALSQKGIRFEKFFYPLENNTVEKSALIAVKNAFPGCERVGFQHSVWYKEQYSMHLSETELELHPLPDRVVCSGEIYLRVLAETGWPQELLSPGANLRFEEINEPNVAKASRESSETLLIVLNFDMNTAFEIFNKLKESLSDRPKLRIRIKPHPLLNKKQLQEFLDATEFPKFEWCEGRVLDLVRQAKVVVMPCASVSNLEVLTLGVPLVRVSMDNNFDFDPIWNTGHLVSLPQGASGLITALDDALAMEESHGPELQDLARHTLKTYFGDITDESMNRFLT